MMMKIAYLALFMVVQYRFVNGRLYAKSLLMAEFSL